MKISIIILSYNTKDLTLRCIETIFQFVKEDFEIIVVDNASDDGSVESIKKLKSSNVKIIVNDSNVGFAKGCNIGAKHAKGEYLLFLNSDTEFTEEGVLSRLIKLFENKKVAAAGGLMLNSDNSYQRSFGSFYTLPHVAKMLFLGEKSELALQKLSTIQETDWVSGGFMVVKKEAFEKVDGFDEGYFMYVEDVDICYRLRKVGYIVVVDPLARILHVGQGSSNRAFAVVNIYKGLTRFYKLHRSGVEYKGLLVLLRLKAYSVLLFGTINGNRELVARYKTALASV